MKIGIYDPYLDSLSGGERYMLTAASCWTAKYKVDVFWDNIEVLTAAEKKFGIDLHNVKIHPNIFSSSSSFFKRFSQTQQYDRIFFLSDGSIPVTFAKKTFVHFQFPVSWVNGKNILTQFKLSRISGIVCNSRFTKRFIDQKFGVKSVVLYPPCGEIKGDVSLEQKKKIILTVGRFQRLPDGSTFKKHELLIDIFKTLHKKELKGWEFVIVVSFPSDQEVEFRKMEKLVQDLPITFIKNGSREELQKLYEEASIYWHAAGFGVDSRKHPELTEHFGISTVEAMSYGAVPIVINAGGQPEVVDDGENGFLWETREALMTKTSEVVLDSKLRQSFAKAAVKKAAQFSTSRFCEELIDIMR